MTQEDKELLLKDLCARLHYGVKCNVPYLKDIRALACIQYDAENTLFDFWDNNESYCRLQLFLSEFKPYLLPLSSMTEEQYNEMEKIVSDDYLENIQITKEMREKVDFITHFPIYCPNVIDWFNKNYFDYRGLIEKGLALDATGLGIY